MKIINDECSAMYRVLNRSSTKLLSNDYICRHLHTAAVLFKNESGSQESKEGENVDKNASKNDSSDSKPSPKKKPSKKKKPSDDGNNATLTMFAKGLLWTSFVYSCTVLLGVLMRRGDQPDANDSQEISWNEFVHHMLMAGEVKEITVVPELEVVRIRLYNDSVVKGRRVRSPVFYMMIPDTAKFEMKIRDVERKMGIKDGKPLMRDMTKAEKRRKNFCNEFQVYRSISIGKRLKYRS